MNAMCAANAIGSDPSSRQASMIGSGDAAASMTRIRQPASARSRHASGSVRSRPEAPGSARNPHSSGLDRGGVDVPEAPRDDAAAQRHRGPRLVVVVREPRMHATMTGHDPVEHATAVRLNGQPGRPLRRCSQATTSPGGVRKPRLCEFPVGVPDPGACQAVSVRIDLRVLQNLRHLRGGADMRVHDPVDERRGLRFGRQGAE